MLFGTPGDELGAASRGRVGCNASAGNHHLSMVGAWITEMVSHVTQFHNRIVLSTLFEINRVPSEENMTLSTREVWPSILRNSLPVRVSQSFTVLSPPALANVSLCGAKATPLTTCLWPSSVCNNLPLCVSQSLIVLSSLALASTSPCGAKAKLLRASSWPLSMR